MIYGFIVIGSGPAGLTAGMYAARLNVKTLVLGLLPGGLLTSIHDIENWPGEKSTSGMDLATKLMDHAAHSGSEMKYEEVISVTKSQDAEGKPTYKAKTTSGEYEAYTLLFATGGKHRTLNVPGEKEFAGKGVSYCALCDANFYKGKTVVVIGGGDAAAKDTLVLAQHCVKVYVIVRSVMRAEPANVKLLEQEPNIEIIYKEEVESISGTAKVEKIKFKSGKEITTDAVFVAIGTEPLNAMAQELGVALNARGEIIVDKDAKTNVPGVFGAGDCTDIDVKQAILGSAQAVLASYGAFRYLRTIQPK